MAVTDNNPPPTGPDSGDPLDAIIEAAHQELLYDPDAQALLDNLAGIRPNAINRFKLGWTQDEHVAIPTFNAAGDYTGLTLYEPRKERRTSDNPKMKARTGTPRDMLPPPESFPPGTPVLIVEGEPDMLVAHSLGLDAIALPGTSGWKPQYAARLAHLGPLALMSDADSVGRKLSERALADLADHPDTVRVIDLFPDDDNGWDLKDDYLSSRANGVTDAQYREYLTGLIEATPDARVPDAPPLPELPAGYRWEIVTHDAMPTEHPAPPTILTVLYHDAINWVQGEPGGGKSLLLKIAMIEAMKLGIPCLLLDYEEGPAMVRHRLDQLGFDAKHAPLFKYIYQPPTPPDHVKQPEAWKAWVAHVQSIEYEFCVVDAVAPSLAQHGYSENSNDDLSAWEARFMLPLTKDATRSVTPIDHVTKSTEGRGQWAIGAQRKRSMVTGAAYTITVTTGFAIDQPGSMILKTTKDRRGHRALDSVALEVRINGTNDRIEYEIRKPAVGEIDPETGEKKPFRPTIKMEQISRLLEVRGSQSKRIIEEDLGRNGTGARKAVRDSFPILETEGYVWIEEKGGSKGHLVHLIKPYRETDDPKADTYNPADYPDPEDTF